MPEKVLNRCVRSICGVWKPEETKTCFMATGWSNIEELSIFRTYVMAKKILEKQGPLSLLERIGEVDSDGNWSIKEINDEIRTDLAKR